MPNRNISDRVRSSRGQAGRATGTLAFMLLLVAGAAGWNYHRNWQIEKQTEGVRPYKSYEIVDLEALKSAYAGELDGVRSQFDEAKRRRVRPTRNGGSIAANVAQFETTARTSAAIREAASNVVERQDQIAELDRELELRAHFGKGLRRHLNRLTNL